MEPIKEESESPPPSTPNPAGNLPHSPNSAFQAATLSAPSTATTTTATASESSTSRSSASLEAGPVVYSQQQAGQEILQEGNHDEDDDDKSTEV